MGRRFGSGRVLNADFFSADGALAAGSVDVMLTSPPYMNNYHYVRNTRPQLYWLNFIASPGEQKYLETHNFGPYWQTVRDATPVALTFTHPELTMLLEQLRATRTAKAPMAVLVGPTMSPPTSTIAFASWRRSSVCWHAVALGSW